MVAQKTPFDAEACVQLHDEAAVLYRAVWNGDTSAFVRDLERHVLQNPLALETIAGRSPRLRQGTGGATITFSIGPLPSRVCRQVHRALALDQTTSPTNRLETFYGHAVRFLARLFDDDPGNRPPQAAAPRLDVAPDAAYTDWSDA